MRKGCLFRAFGKECSLSIKSLYTERLVVLLLSRVCVSRLTITRSTLIRADIIVGNTYIFWKLKQKHERTMD